MNAQEFLDYVDQLPNDSTARDARRRAWMAAIPSGLLTGALVLNTAWWFLVITIAVMLAVAVLDKRLQLRNGVRASLRQDPYRTPKFTWRQFGGCSAVFWPAIGAFINDVGLDGIAKLILAAVVALLGGAHIWWAAATDAWNARL